jgi:hypothetical protein
MGDLALFALGEQSGAATAGALALGIIPGGKLVGKLGGFLGKIGASAWRGAKHYAAKYGRTLINATGAGAILSLGKKALNFIRKGCGCFEAGTQVWTQRGLLPIEQVEQGDLVYAQDEATGELSLREVVRTFVRRAAPIVAVTITTAAGADQTLNTTEEHPFYVDSRGWTAAQTLQPGDEVALADGGMGAVQALHFTNARRTVYNFEVEGLHNYFVGRKGVLVHNPNCFRPFTQGNFNYNLSALLPPPSKDYHAHHIIPKRFQGLFPNRNLHDPTTNGAWVHKDVHVGRGGSITEEWETWARNHPAATAQDVLDFANDLQSRAGLWMIRP